ncbi:MAG: MmcQ/YjbR family DNA-binding protein [Acidobacteria bacterium]|nr:MmcQ/YjbR family DNA-binding protein [Acidobacteriota bacterium]
MNHESVREFCLDLPHAIERVQWGNDLLFCVGGKMFAVIPLGGPAPHQLTFKCTPEEFVELTEREGIEPAPYVARYHWVALRRFDVFPAAELQRLLRDSYQMVFDKLPKSVKENLAKAAPRKRVWRKSKRR